MKKLDTSRLKTAKETNHIAIAAGTTRKFYGVTEDTLTVLFSREKKSAVLYDVIPPGRFETEITADTDMTISFITKPKKMLSLLGAAPETVVTGDADEMWTTVGHRPAINPQIAALQAQMRLRDLALHQEQQKLAMEASVANAKEAADKKAFRMAADEAAALKAAADKAAADMAAAAKAAAEALSATK